jgi:hypothetical protein
MEERKDLRKRNLMVKQIIGPRVRSAVEYRQVHTLFMEINYLNFLTGKTYEEMARVSPTVAG